MAPAAAVTTASRRAKRVIESESPASSPAISRSASGSEIRVAGRDVPDDDDAEGEEEVEEEEYEDEDGEGEEEDDDGEAEKQSFATPSDDEMDVDEVQEEVEAQPPSSAIRIKLKVGNASARTARATEEEVTTLWGKRPARAAAQKSGKRTKRVAMEQEIPTDDELLLGDTVAEDDADELMSGGESSRRSTSPSKMTARQRSRNNQDLQDTLLALPMDPGNKKLVLTEAEKVQRREETARRRKRQSEQKLQDEQDQTINRLLRAQTGRSRAKLDVPSPALDEGTAASSRMTSPSRRIAAPSETTVRWVSSVVGDKVVMRVGAPKGKEKWIDLVGPVAPLRSGGAGGEGVCAVDGCREKRKYRSVKQFEVGGCCVDHLKRVDAGLA